MHTTPTPSLPPAQAKALRAAGSALALAAVAQASAIDRPAAESVLFLLDEVRAMLWRMTHPR